MNQMVETTIIRFQYILMMRPQGVRVLAMELRLGDISFRD
jgi:hypothetical protein